MKESPDILIPALEDVYLCPADLADATATPIRDEEMRLLRDEQGLIIYEG
jgi:hypothetical protein